MSLTVDSNNPRAVINAQYNWLKTLQLIQPNKQAPIRVKAIEGNLPKGEDFDLYGWKPFQNIWSKVNQPIYTRGILPNELLIDPDTPEWSVMKEGIDKLCNYCRENNIPFIAGYSGGKGVHISIFFKYSSLEKTYPYDIDVFKTIRMALITALAECAEVNLDNIRLDQGKIIFNEASKGSQVRTFGTMRAAGQYKTLIEEIPNHKPDPYTLSLTFPKKVNTWEIEGTKFEPVVLEAIDKEIKRAAKSNEYPTTNMDFSGTEIMSFPCVKKLFEIKLLEGRYYAGESVLLVCKQCGISKDETEQHMRQLFKTFPGITQAETDLRISNALTMYHTDKNFSCRVLKEHFSKYNLCDFSKCPIKGKIKEKRAPKVETTPEFRELTVDEIQARKESFKDRKLPLVLPPSHFVSIFCNWLSSITDGYEDYQDMGALWLISSFCDYNVVVKLKQETVRPNISATIFGRSTTSRKSTVVNRTRQVHESVTGSYLPNEDFSIEGYLESLSKNPTQHHVRDEVAGFLAKIHKQYNEGFNELECALYDGQNFRKTLASKGNKDPKVFNIKSPYITKLYATTPDNYFKYMEIEDFLCGKEFRTLFVYPTYNKNKMALGVETAHDIDNWLLVLKRASTIYNFIKNSDGIEFKFENGALEYYSEITSKMEDAADKSDNSILSSAVGRSQIHILKLAMLIELGKDPISTTITKESLAISANAVVTYFIPTLMDIVDMMQEDIRNNMVEKVVYVIRRQGGAIQHTKALHDTKLKSRDFAEVIETLQESETIEKVIESTTKKPYYILTEMKKGLDLSVFQPASKNLQNLQNLSSHSISIDRTSTEILETLINITQSDIMRLGEESTQNNVNSYTGEVRQSNNIISLLNLSPISTMRDEETREIREIKEIQTVNSSVVSEEEGFKILKDEGY